MTFDQKIKQRADDTYVWLQENHPECQKEQAHLDKGTPERAYWHFGYYMALRDILALMNQQLEQVNCPEGDYTPGSGT
jgi:hypothetical protein